MSELLQQLATALGDAPGIALAAALIWGVLSVILSPCHLAGIPLLIAYVNDQEQNTPWHAALLSTLFALGILITMALIGLGTGWAGRMAGDTGPVGGYVMTAIFILFGLHLMDLISIPWVGAHKEQVHNRGGWGALLLGLVFGLASGPCTFAFLAPLLAVIFDQAGENSLLSTGLLGLYALGHCIVLIVAGTCAELTRRFSNWSRDTRMARRSRFVLGLLLIAAGLYFLYRTV